MKITINDIAKMAGVSISTVSRVVNNSKPVNDDVRRRVMSAIKETNYRGGLTSSDAAGPKADSSLIGVILPHNSNTVLDDFNTGINHVADLYGYDVTVGLTDATVDNELGYLRLFGGIGLQGIIFAGSPLNERHLEIIREFKLPCVVVGEISPDPSIPSVHVDNITASFEAVMYLIQKGHRRIGMIRGKDEGVVGGHRFEGYARALSEAGLELNEQWIAESGMSVEDGMEAMSRLEESSGGKLPTAVFCSTDWMAIGAMNYLLDHGYKVPEDVAVFGFDGSFMSSVVRPQLSTVSYSATEIGMTATRKLIKLIKGEQVQPPHTNVTHHLTLRGSTR
ncbi:LacI family DNA-binding transcriptional regulator [Paenibacillus pinistramenti]|uniref:LacI family DNA-binding transcriptional regulator n=1 Tax=Paenibacillus pinistramenti TaxID=1768003 RepID=UPI0011088AF6|nr:LacI family DNA-binding transcriptional regulator [Paenibacillus pinistramenti]